MQPCQKDSGNSATCTRLRAFGFDQDRAGGQGVKAGANGPVENLAGVVVDDSVDVNFSAVDELDDGDIAEVEDQVFDRGNLINGHLSWT
jgi:hypothetical protein